MQGKFGRVEEFLAAGEAGDPHTKPFFFPVVSAATCTDSFLEVDQRLLAESCTTHTCFGVQAEPNYLQVVHLLLQIVVAAGGAAPQAEQGEVGKHLCPTGTLTEVKGPSSGGPLQT
ncbi:hypothetical protein Taro_029391 [Colocasia esculenta]|uniref:Uncharacterized protein n=1 Tax=Colocasia esculenta TaxID=4460 RepID=A0A843VDP7_COLES|nr:hypothetical protein [Colocasia esculenta]